MRCVKSRKLISAHLDGELDEPSFHAARKHMDHCPACRTFAEEVNEVAAELDVLSLPEPRPGFTGRLMTRIPERRKRAAFSWSWLDFLRPAPFGVGLAAFILGMMLTVIVPGESPTQTAAVTPANDVPAGEYFETVSDDAFEEQLLALLPQTER